VYSGAAAYIDGWPERQSIAAALLKASDMAQALLKVRQSPAAVRLCFCQLYETQTKTRPPKSFADTRPHQVQPTLLAAQGGEQTPCEHDMIDAETPQTAHPALQRKQ
jgi:hypothetical protein